MLPVRNGRLCWLNSETRRALKFRALLVIHVLRDLTRIWQFDLHFQHFKVVLAFQIDFDVVGIDLDVFTDHSNQFTLQIGKVVGLCRVATAAFVRQNDLQALFGHVGGFFLFSKKE